MSPEERADLWLNECCIYKPDLYRESLAAAFRAAESDAAKVVAAARDVWLMSHRRDAHGPEDLEYAVDPEEMEALRDALAALKGR